LACQQRQAAAPGRSAKQRACTLRAAGDLFPSNFQLGMPAAPGRSARPQRQAAAPSRSAKPQRQAAAPSSVLLSDLFPSNSHLVMPAAPGRVWLKLSK